jgi:nucleoid-associated protein YgaU
MTRWGKAAAAAAVLVALLGGLPYGLITYVGNPWPGGGLTWTGTMSDGAIAGLLAVVLWLVWALFALCVAGEILAVLRELSNTGGAVRVPACGVPGLSGLAAWAVNGVLAVAVATPALGAMPAAATPTGVPAPPGLTSTAPTSTAPTVSAHAVTHEADPAVDPQRTDSQHTERLHTEGRHSERPDYRTVVVGHLDNLYTIARTHLGDGERWPEIAQLNQGRTMNDGGVFIDPEVIEEGWELRIPAEPAESAESAGSGGMHVVEQGEYLSRIALQELGDANRWPELYQANRDVVGSNPNLIYPGQRLDLPAARPGSHDNLHTPPVTPEPNLGHDHGNQERADRERADQPPTEKTPDAPAHAPHSPAVPAVPEASAPAVDGSSSPEAATATEQDEDGFSALRALLAGAGCLAFGALTLVAANRRRQFRWRRPGRMIAATPADLVAIERAVAENGVQAQDDVEFLDRALRHVAASCRAAAAPLPQLGAAVLGADELTLLFTHPAVGEAPTGWAATDDARAWTLPRPTILEDDLLRQPAPYPALVTIGEDEGGRTWLLDLETLGVFGIAGPRDQVCDLTRFLIAELAVNAWSEGTEVLLAGGFGTETVRLNPGRLRQVDREAALLRATALAHDATESEANLDTDLLGLRRDGELLDSTGPLVVVVSGRAEGDFVEAIEQRDRSRVVVVHDDPADPAIELTGDQMAFLPRWGIRVKAFTLPESDAEAMAALVASTRNLADQPMPATADEGGPLGRYATADGALREEFTEPRHPAGHDASSLLPEPDEVYLATAATTPEDLAALAPSVPQITRAELEALDPTLDQDVADWLDPASIRPKVHLLGPVDVTAAGGTREGIANLAGTIELIVYLACQERGVTGERAADACGWKRVKTVQNRAIDARKLLGTRPDGTDWLPDAGKTESAKRGVPTYEIDKGTNGVIVDADLLVRLKVRAQKRGEDGIEDLSTALSLVAGEPFDDLRRGGYGWLFTGQRHDQILVAAIHDAAHVLATGAMAEGRTDLVRHACDAALRANPHSDVAWLDLAAAAEADTGRASAEELVREQVLDRVDEDLPPRTEAVIDRRGWLSG